MDERRQFWVKALQENSGSLLKYARRLCNGDESRAEDLRQQVSVRILTYLPEPDSIGSTKAYLRLVLYTRWTTSKPRGKETSLDDAVEKVVQFPVRLSELNVVMETLLEEMAPDFPDLQTIVEMRLSGYSLNAIDEFLGRDPGYAQTIWRRFFNKLRKLLTPH